MDVGMMDGRQRAMGKEQSDNDSMPQALGSVLNLACFAFLPLAGMSMECKKAASWYDIDYIVSPELSKISVIFLDLTDVVTKTRGVIGTLAWRRRQKRHLGRDMTVDEWTKIDERMLDNGFLQLVEEGIPADIRAWRDLGIKVAGITNRKQSDKTRIIDLLYYLGIELDDIICTLKPEGFPGRDKEEAMLCFLEKQGYGKNAVIYFMDDNIETLKHIQSSIKLSEQFRFHAIHFTGETVTYNTYKAFDYIDFAMSSFESEEQWGIPYEYALNALEVAHGLAKEEYEEFLRDFLRFMTRFSQESFYEYEKDGKRCYIGGGFIRQVTKYVKRYRL